MSYEAEERKRSGGAVVVIIIVAVLALVSDIARRRCSETKQRSLAIGHFPLI
jgi:hypothetical protein